MRAVFAFLGIIVLWAVIPTNAASAGETTEKVICRSVDAAARDNLLPVTMLTRLLWVESRFQADAVSPAGALGLAQFMPATAAERGLVDPFDPESAIRHAAKLLADLDLEFGNVGLAVAAYNAGTGRVAKWLAGDGPLPHQTQGFVLAITGHTPDQWAASARPRAIEAPTGFRSCTTLASLHHLTPGIQRRHMLSGVEDRGRPLPEMERSGRLLPSLERSGHLLPGIGRSGRVLPQRGARDAG